MAELSSELAGYLAGKNENAAAIFLAFRDAVLAVGEVEERVHRTDVTWADRRAFAVAFTLSSRLEISIDLLRQVEHPLLLQAFPTTKRVITHRLSLTSPDQVDENIRALLVESFDTVGPGTR
ncbi:DUF5655 domain-containing protein [Arthrobacter sp. VKM Ac-2550]|uniref:DUF5655 domain-containing protein n=1 Tax=Crystallibacter permensis TaxID=1938888 RepID=UPI002227A073|nr:DUF5655 domain-containing protein [Arthrobacter sp. VKM Ac-2550]MCW2131001.1 hypothetical protein [Arthrobacter sp. VKM Ac-2550]